MRKWLQYLFRAAQTCRTLHNNFLEKGRIEWLRARWSLSSENSAMYTLRNIAQNFVDDVFEIWSHCGVAASDFQELYVSLTENRGYDKNLRSNLKEECWYLKDSLGAEHWHAVVYDPVQYRFRTWIDFGFADKYEIGTDFRWVSAESSTLRNLARIYKILEWEIPLSVAKFPHTWPRLFQPYELLI